MVVGLPGGKRDDGAMEFRKATNLHCIKKKPEVVEIAFKVKSVTVKLNTISQSFNTASNVKCVLLLLL